MAPTNPCYPSPCGPNAQCRLGDGIHAICTCLPGFFGSSPACRPECVVASDCAQVQTCLNQRCVDPCAGHCGPRAECYVTNHQPRCECRSGFTGNALTASGCRAIGKSFATGLLLDDTHNSPWSLLAVYDPPAQPADPCLPSPCGPYSECRIDARGQAACSCLTDYIGSAPNCRPECTTNQQCPNDRACVNRRCANPCASGTCGQLAQCFVVQHTANCVCPDGMTGDPFVGCRRSQDCE